MKRFLLLTLTLTLIFTGITFAQAPDQHRMGPRGMGMERGPGCMMGKDMPMPGQMHGCMAGVNLTEDQKKELAKMQLAQQRVMTKMHTELAGIHGKIKLLMTADKLDKKELEKLANTVSEAHKTKLKAHVEHVRKIRDMLTPDQRIFFDRNIMAKGHMGHGPKHHSKRGRSMRGCQ